MNRPSHLPVRRRLVMAGTAVALAMLAGMVVGAEWLRHPQPTDPSAAADAFDDDPRQPLVCPEPRPREGRDRDLEATPGPVADPAQVTSGDLLGCPESYDRVTVRYRGEAVGGVLRRSDGVWVQLNDDVYAASVGPLPGHRQYHGANAGLGVFLPTHLAGGITTVGGPQTRGDLVEVVGVFRRVDASSREVAVVHAHSMRLIRPGGPAADPLLRDRQLAAAVLALLAVAAVATERVVARRRLRP